MIFSSALPLLKTLSPPTDVGIAGAHQLENTSLAVQLCRQWLKDMGRWEEEKELEEEETTHSCGINIANPFSLPINFMKGQ